MKYHRERDEEKMSMHKQVTLEVHDPLRKITMIEHIRDQKRTVESFSVNERMNAISIFFLGLEEEIKNEIQRDSVEGERDGNQYLPHEKS